MSNVKFKNSLQPESAKLFLREFDCSVDNYNPEFIWLFYRLDYNIGNVKIKNEVQKKVIFNELKERSHLAGEKVFIYSSEKSEIIIEFKREECQECLDKFIELINEFSEAYVQKYNNHINEDGYYEQEPISKD